MPGLSSLVRLVTLAVEFREAVAAFGAGRPESLFPILARCCLGEIAVRDGSSVSSLVALSLGERLSGSATKAAASCKTCVSSRLYLHLKETFAVVKRRKLNVLTITTRETETREQADSLKL